MECIQSHSFPREINATTLKLVTISIEVNLKGIIQAIQTMKNLIQSDIGIPELIQVFGKMD